ncbi:MAG TPA: FtsX-like permease family protein [Stellaceae bacterium]|jgi:putative ABC transport system permease protein|nr:FtsX-like permease family protein [Stellaceae bacterium]
MMLKLAFRNIFRNTRRSLTTLSTIAIGGAAVLVFGAYVTYIELGVQTGAVQRTGHFQIFRKGYFDFGTGNPAAWGIDDYQTVLALLRDDPVLQPMTAVATPIQNLAGIAGNFDNDTSKTFFGVGFVPSNRDKMKRWNEYGTGSQGLQHSGLTDDNTAQGIVGIGLARILGMCEPLHLDNCPPAPKRETEPAGPPLATDVAALAASEKPAGPSGGDAGPRIDLLAATAGGAPNVVSLNIARVESQPFKELDDNYVGLNLTLAQQLVYGRGEPKATGIVLQLKRSEDVPAARARLAQLISDRKLDLEIRDFTDLTPEYNQIIGLFNSIFSFISVIIGVVVLFTVTNAMGMSVVERTDEIGTTRAIGVRRSGIRRQFLVEGAVLGVMGATIGVVLAYAAAYAVNGSGLTWVPPGAAQPVPLRLYMEGAWNLLVGTWLGLIVVATIAAFIPAHRAARMKVVDALRHV